jgi:hypothetical protein
MGLRSFTNDFSIVLPQRILVFLQIFQRKNQKFGLGYAIKERVKKNGFRYKVWPTVREFGRLPRPPDLETFLRVAVPGVGKFIW